MKTALSFPILALLLTACAPHPPANEPAPAARGATPSNVAPAVTPAAARAGKIVSVKSELRFVVVDFSLSGVPAEGTAMAVYRAGQKVAEVRITGPSVGTNTAADITAGEVQPGDEVRDP
jgi:hypothetical protein